MIRPVATAASPAVMGTTAARQTTAAMRTGTRAATGVFATVMHAEMLGECAGTSETVAGTMLREAAAVALIAAGKLTAAGAQHGSVNGSATGTALSIGTGTEEAAAGPLLQMCGAVGVRARRTSVEGTEGGRGGLTTAQWGGSGLVPLARVPRQHEHGATSRSGTMSERKMQMLWLRLRT